MTFVKKESACCETKTLLASLSFILLVAASSCIYQVQTEKKTWHQSEVKSQSPCKNDYEKYCLNGGECHYLAHEDIVGCKNSRLHRGKRCEKQTNKYGGAKLELNIRKDAKSFNQNMSRRIFSIQNFTQSKYFFSKGDETKTFCFRIWFLKKIQFKIQFLKQKNDSKCDFSGNFSSQNIAFQNTTKTAKNVVLMG